MKEFITGIILIILFSTFSLFIINSENSNSIMEIYTPTKFGIDFNKNNSVDNNEIFCIEGIESFSMEPSEEFYESFAIKNGLNHKQLISLGYLAQDFAQNTLKNKRVQVKKSDKISSECRYGEIYTNGMKYSEMLKHSGFGIINGEIGEPKNFEKNLFSANKLNLVILNHKSNKYHKLDCPYGKIAHDTVYIPKKHLPKQAKQCKYCHLEKNKKFNVKKETRTKIPQIPQPPLVITDDNIKIIFTDYTKNLKPHTKCITNVCSELLSHINNATESIDIAIYGYSEIPGITQSLQKAKNRGVKIRFIYDSKFDPSENYYPSNQKIIDLATSHRSDITDSKTQSNMLMHNKFIIFDNKTVFTGSMNISPTGLSDYDVNSIAIIKSEQIANIYKNEFEQMLNGRFHKLKQCSKMPNKFTLNNSEVEVYFSPQDKPSIRIIQLIQNAQKYIYIPTFLITHKNITEELINAKLRGVDVRVIIDANSTSTKNTKHTILRENKILLKTENYAGKVHSKTMIIDDEILVLGSMNFSNSGDNKNDENVLIIKNPKLAKAHKDFFLYLWTLIPNKYLKTNPKAESYESIGACSDGVDNNFNGEIDNQDAYCKRH